MVTCHNHGHVFSLAVNPVHLCVNQRRALLCSLGEDATEIRWEKNGQPYSDGIFQQTSRSSIAQVAASPGLNGSRFDCLASFDGSELKVIDSWIIVVHESKKEGDYACRLSSSQDSKLPADAKCSFSVYS